MAIAARVKLSYDDLRLFPEDGKRHETIDGEHIISPVPKTAHQNASGNLSALLHGFARQHSLGRVFSAPFDVVFSDFDVTEPDLLFISREREKILTEDNARGAPDLIVEILSPSTTEIDRKVKYALYEKYGVREYWIITPDAEIVQIFALRPGGYELLGNFSGKEEVRSEVLSRFTCRAEEIFAA
ncbi:MAG: Uma2 family endonuclease [Chloroflexota bacterium]|nr:Uma2 family endonuclease [Chloroflexota bacterium]